MGTQPLPTSWKKFSKMATDEVDDLDELNKELHKKEKEGAMKKEELEQDAEGGHAMFWRGGVKTIGK